MENNSKKPISKTLISLLCVFAIILTGGSVFLTVQNYNLHSRVTSAMASVDKTNDKYEQIKSENNDIKKQNEELEKHNVDLEYKLEASKKEVADKNTLLKKVGVKKLIEAEKELAIENSIQEKVEPKSKVCYLTFDDGPSDRTLEILEILDRYDAKATFFVVGSAKLNYLPRIVEKGHTIGLHSNTHTYSKIYKSTDAFFEDLNALSDKVYNITGIHSKIMRFPGGGSNKVSKQYCKGVMTRLTSQVVINGYAYFDWNVDSGDASGNKVPATTLINNVLNGAAKKNSICVLMHDTSSKTTTVEALPKMLEGLEKMGYRFEALKETSYGFHHTVKN